MKQFLVRGVPASLQRDGWWIDDAIQPYQPSDHATSGLARSGAYRRFIVLVGLILLADFLLWGARPGLSLALFGGAVLLACYTISDRRGWGGVCLGIAAALPLVEEVQAISLVFWGLGLWTGRIWIVLGRLPGLPQITLPATSMLAGPTSFALTRWRDRPVMASALRHRPTRDLIRRIAKSWAFPLCSGLIFFALLIMANPVLARFAQGVDLITPQNLSRVAFWLGIGSVLWPVLRLPDPGRYQASPVLQFEIGMPVRPSFLDQALIGRSLILFNLILGAHTLLDAAYLMGGIQLPDGMSYADYAHRGAYPLAVAALLAGIFSLLARPFTDTDRALRIGLLIWICQTMLLVMSFLLRLDLYIGAYGLTRLRLSAGIWMGFVAVCLILILWQVLHHHSAGWLIRRASLLAALLLYGCMFVSFDRSIARYNLTRDVPADASYLCGLSAAALPEIRQLAPALCDGRIRPSEPLQTDWREWGFRDWRVLRSLTAMTTTISGR